MTTFNLSDKLTFGKYKGRAIGEIVVQDPQYIRWCLRTIEWFNVSKPVINALLTQLSPQEPKETLDLGTGGFCEDDGEYHDSRMSRDPDQAISCGLRDEPPINRRHGRGISLGYYSDDEDECAPGFSMW